jgi:hypothetical protein
MKVPSGMPQVDEATRRDLTCAEDLVEGGLSTPKTA